MFYVVLSFWQVYARFLAKDHDSGRVSYFVSRRTWLKVTELVLSLMRVSDPRIASLRGRVLQGRTTGRTEVQVLSPITGKQYNVLKNQPPLFVQQIISDQQDIFHAFTERT